MEIPNIVSCIAVVPWAWILMKLIMFGDVFNLLPMAILGYLLYLLDNAIRKRNLDKMIAKQDQLLKRKDSPSQTVQCEFAEKSIQAKQDNVDAFTQTERRQIQEVSTQTVQAKIDAFTQMEYKEFDVKETQTICPIMEEKEVQTLWDKPKKRKFKLRPTFFWKKKVQTQPKPSKPRVPAKKRNPQPTIPLTDEFLNYHREKHAYLRRKIKFSPKLDEIREDDEDVDEPEICNLQTKDESGPELTEIGENTMEKKDCMMLPQSGDSCTQWLEASEKQSKPAFWRKKLKKLLKVLKK
ncbi:hypothetical protein AVEN_222357-1 [Araneus ventricosus]|uniref:Uncharacterized protein n=1 Tax=Araneus ventricosus TaxID=182803 RepID=A0A4Y2NK41_ARAVE|nr:hypothetical protein AVEN_222357-1 [Araneus ventricosus]